MISMVSWNSRTVLFCKGIFLDPIWEIWMTAIFLKSSGNQLRTVSFFKVDLSLTLYTKFVFVF